MNKSGDWMAHFMTEEKKETKNRKEERKEKKKKRVFNAGAEPASSILLVYWI